MREHSQTRNGTFDPFGERTAAEAPSTDAPIPPQWMRNLALAVFWGLVAAALAGRIYLDVPSFQSGIARLAAFVLHG